MDNILTVRELNFKLSQVLQARFPYIWIKGEVTNCTKASSGHLYFSLKDEQDLLNCVWFKRSHQDLAFDPLTGECYENGSKPSLAHSLRDGQEIICAGKLAVYGARGQYQLIVEHAIESGTGQLYEAFERLKQKLLKEGLFDSKYKKSIPASIHNIALITAPSGAVIHDFLRIAQSRGVQSRIFIFPSLVQGNEAPQELLQALKKAENYIFPDQQKADCIVFIRGGGSIQDLWAFNDEELARAIFACPIPVLTGIGHEPDFSIADYVSDKSLATPSHVAQFLWQDKQSLIQQIDDIEYSIQSAFINTVNHKEKDLFFLYKNLEFISPKNKLNEKFLQLLMLDKHLFNASNKIILSKQNALFLSVEKLKRYAPDFRYRTDLILRTEKDFNSLIFQNIQKKANRLIILLEKMQNSFAKYIQKNEISLQEFTLRLEGNNPHKPLKKGYVYAEITNKNNKAVKSVNDLKLDDSLQLYVFDGTVQTTVQKIIHDENNSINRFNKNNQPKK